MLAGDADRERAVEVLKDAFTEGRLAQDEYEERVGRAYQARTFRQLDELTGDIPRPAPMVFGSPPFQPLPLPSSRRVNSLAVASLVCGLAGLGLAVPSIPAIVLGHAARRQIRRTGERGAALATVGLVLGYSMAVFLLGLMFSIGIIAMVIHGA